MTPEQLEKNVHLAVKHLRSFCPEKTGNLKNNAIKFERINKSEYRIYIDESVAPYMPFTNEPWTSDYWNGKKNPNEKWFDRATEYIVEYLASINRGKAKKVGD
jgi:hypothetical protein